MSELVLDEIPHLIPLPAVCAALGCSEQSLKSYLVQHGVPMTCLSRSKRGLLSSDYQLLLQRCRTPSAGAARAA